MAANRDTTETTKKIIVVDPTKEWYTIPEFCHVHHISTPTYYKMRAQGLGPREIRLVGSVVRISKDAARDWIASRVNASGAEAERVEAQRAALKARSAHATGGGAA